ncbi:Kelch-like protein, partial [Drosera capensis]
QKIAKTLSSASPLISLSSLLLLRPRRRQCCCWALNRGSVSGIVVETRMGRGRTKIKLTLQEKSAPQWTMNCSISARNLSKSQLGGVIFGCTRATYDECILKQLFGLPAPHFAYVKNVTVNMPLFLFNYSDRKLHGIFEAAGPGQMNLDTCAWTLEGSEKTSFPAQVRVKVRIQCASLSEDQFGPIITGNYYEHNHFWLELDKKQAQQLTSLFSQSPVNHIASAPKRAAKWGSFFVRGDSEVPVHANSGRTDAFDVSSTFSYKMAFKKENGNSEAFTDNGNKENHGTAVVPLASKTWSSLFKPTSGVSIERDGKSCQMPASGESIPHPTQSNIKWESLPSEALLNNPFAVLESFSHDADTDEWEEDWESPNVKNSKFAEQRQEGHSLFADEQLVVEDSQIMLLKEDCTDADRLDKADEEKMISQFQESYELTMATSCPEEHRQKHYLFVDEQHLAEDSKTRLVNEDYTNSDNWGNWDKVDENKMMYQFQESFHFTEATSFPEKYWEEHSLSADEHVAEDFKIKLPEEDSSLELNTESSSNIQVPCQNDVPIEASSEVNSLKTEGQSITLMKIMQAIDGMTSQSMEQGQRIQALEQGLALYETKMQKLQSKLRAFETGSSLSTCNGKGDESENSNFELEDSIFIVGGSNGSSWLSSLDSYYPTRDLLRCLLPMGSVRCCASATKLAGELFVFGGRDATCRMWYDTVESYDQANDHWASRPSLNKKKGNLAGASLASKIYAIGGADNKECYSEVEMLDPNIGKWITTRSMFEKRMAPASAEIHGAIYVGGFDGMQYLNSMERFDPREHSWSRLANMNKRRGCHCVAVLNEKLFAIGGFDGDAMTSTVEVFDSRVASWMMVEPMYEPRGYMGAVTIGKSIYVIAGMKQSTKGSDLVSSTVECYTEGYGWEITGLKSVRRRCFFSAVVA